MIGTLLQDDVSMQQRVGLQSDCPFVVSLDCGFVECHHDFVRWLLQRNWARQVGARESGMGDANDATAVCSVFLVWKRVVEQAHTLPYLNQPCRARWDEQDCLQVGIRGHDLHTHAGSGLQWLANADVRVFPDQY